MIAIDNDMKAVVVSELADLCDPLNDLGNARMEIVFTFGPEAMQTFTDHYLAQTRIDATYLPYWDLVAALHRCGRMSEWGPDADDEGRMRERPARIGELDARAWTGRPRNNGRVGHIRHNAYL